MNYILRKVNCKALIVVLFVFVVVVVCPVRAYAYTVRKIPSFWFDQKYVFFAEGVSPRETSYTAVTIGYDKLADLVSYCNEHNLSTSLVYNSAIERYVGWVNDTSFKITELGLTSSIGLLCNVDGKVYVAQREGGSTSTTYNIYNYNQTTITHHSNSASGTTSTPYVSSSWADRRLQEELYKDVDYINQRMSIANGYLSNIGWLLIDIRSYIEKNIVPGMEALNKNMVSFMGAAVSRLDDAVNQLSSIQSASWASVDVENRLLSSLDDLSSNISGVIVDGAVKVTSSPDPAVAEALTGIQNTLTSVISNGKVLVDNSDVVSAIQSFPAYDDSALVSAVTTISNQITEQFGEYESTYSFPVVSTSGQLDSRDKIVSGVLPSSFSSINPSLDFLFYSPSSTLTLSQKYIYTGSGICDIVACRLRYDSTYGLGYAISFIFRFPTSQSTVRTETVQFPRVSFTDYSGKTLTLYEHSGSVRVPANASYVTEYSYYFPRWDASGNWLGWSGYNDTFDFTSSSYEPSKRIYLAPPESGTYYIYGSCSNSTPVVYASRFTGFLQSQTDRVVNAVGSIPEPIYYTDQLTAVTGRMDDILAQLQSTSGSATCEHTYSQHMEQEATCILPGLMISTCSKCGDSSSEIVDPLGHDWQCTSHVDAVTDPDTGEETSSAYDIYTCSRCGDTYEDHTGTGAPDEDYSNTTISQLVVKVFSKLGTFAGKLIGFIVRLFDKAISSVDEVISKFNEYTEQISGFGGDYPAWLTGFWTVLPSELQVALTFAVVCMVLGIVGKKLFFS